MTRFQLILAFVLTLLITLAAGAVHGRLSGRWGGSSVAREAIESLQATPEQFGQWRLEKQDPLDESAYGQLEPYAYLNRTYVHLNTGVAVSVFVLLGPVGQTAVHNPEVCYSSRNYPVTEAKEPVTLRLDGQRADQLFATTFRSNNLEGGLLRVYFGWSSGRHWEATDKGRFKFAFQPYLYKIQIATNLPSETDLKKEDACRAFLEDFLPVLRQHMVPAKSMFANG